MLESRKRDIRRQAYAFREKCKVSRYGIIDLFEECERLGYKLLRYPLGEDADLGFVMKRDSDIVVFTNTCSRLAREIFTLAHEIGHIVLHLEKVDSFIDDAITIAGRSTDEKEKEANYFASCLLMPEDEVDKFLDLEIANFDDRGLTAMDIARIMSEFNVSFEMALNRLSNLGKIDGNERAGLDNERIRLRVGNLLKSVGGNQRLNVATEEIEIPHEYIEYVIDNYNHNVIPRETLEKVLECYHLTIEDISDKLVERKVTDDDLDTLLGGIVD